MNSKEESAQSTRMKVFHINNTTQHNNMAQYITHLELLRSIDLFYGGKQQMVK
jgi:hypothetical protein